MPARFGVKPSGAAAAAASAAAGAMLATGSTPSGAPSAESMATRLLSFSTSTVTSEPYTGMPCRVWRNLTVLVPVSGTVSVPMVVNLLVVPFATGAVSDGKAGLASACSRNRRAAVSGSMALPSDRPSGRRPATLA